tara:strand:+ start:884 stop:1141 length:258 start_codon:yes stop_codon:yes gene_type:complete
MALPSSGQISVSAIKTELSITAANNSWAGGATPVSSSLFGSATSAVNKVAPHKISEFHGYTHISHGGGGGGGSPPPGGGGGPGGP